MSSLTICDPAPSLPRVYEPFDLLLTYPHGPFDLGVAVTESTILSGTDRMSLGTHTGTHVDAPRHVLRGSVEAPGAAHRLLHAWKVLHCASINLAPCSAQVGLGSGPSTGESGTTPHRFSAALRTKKEAPRSLY
ncbi:cyclase family protein [Microbacterium sp. Leaf159]|uniref:cyclase family protein n=1 Tax=Microbacterium sp. Leaf159 TaxID=1736279 RepID=UPI0009E966F3